MVDDEAAARSEMERLLRSSEGVAPPDLAETADEALERIRAREYDAVFLDIRMPGMSGLEALPLIEREASGTDVVFVTAYDQHALEAFELAAADYLLKPVSELRLRRTLDRLRARRARTRAPAAPQVDRLAVDGRTGTLLLRLADVRFVRAQGHTVLAKTFEGEHRTRSSLAELEERLGPHGFLRVHRGFLVNLEHVMELEPFFNGTHVLRMDDRERSEIPVGRSAAPRLRAIFGI